MKHHFFVILFFFVFSTISSKANLPIENVKTFQITNSGDSIQFIKIDADTSLTKPTILFCQGSLPIPLIIDQKFTSMSNFDYQSISKKYHIIVISMPHTPIAADENHLNNQYCYVPDTLKPHNYDIQYWESNYLERYVKRGNTVLDFLRKQRWVDKNKIILFGHSQGTYIAVRLAEQNPDIYAIGYASGNILGRYSGFILQERNAARKGIISKEEAQENIEKKYEWWKIVCRDTTDFSIEMGDSKKTWKSFSAPILKQLTDLKMPVFVSYGTEDDGAQMCDILPIYFELVGKTNYKMRPFVGCGHNFEEITPDGKHNWDKMYWKEAMNEFIDWCESLE
ncbi:MAG: alpha/beta hydrolase family protein [Prevotellaceae bacterium]|jgi:pimeloyl-ACP methyl ester carboxylesterase|nr:alpha/beta hydrolase family protein [Prevotellaceae bacterium]